MESAVVRGKKRGVSTGGKVVGERGGMREEGGRQRRPASAKEEQRGASEGSC